MTSGRGTGPMTPRQPIELVFDLRCQFQLKHHQLGENEKRSTTVLSPLLVLGRGFFVARIKSRKPKSFMSEHHGFMKALKCRECGREYPLEATRSEEHTSELQ